MKSPYKNTRLVVMGRKDNIPREVSYIPLNKDRPRHIVTGNNGTQYVRVQFLTTGAREFVEVGRVMKIAA